MLCLVLVFVDLSTNIHQTIPLSNTAIADPRAFKLPPLCMHTAAAVLSWAGAALQEPLV